MKAAVLEDVHKIAIRDIEDLSPGPDELMIQTVYLIQSYRLT